MEVSYKFGQDQKANKKIFHTVSRSIYQNNRRLKLLNIFDFIIIVFVFLAIFAVFGLLSNYQDIFDAYGDGEKAAIFRYALIVIVFIFSIYLFSIRPSMLNYIARDKSQENVKEQGILLRIDEDGLYQKVDQHSGFSVIGYDLIIQIVHLQEHLVLIFKNTSYIAIPFTAFINEEHRIRFETALREKTSIE